MDASYVDAVFILTVYQAVAHWASVTACRMGIIILFQGRLVALDQIGHNMGRNFAK